jgi:hypothetical protein
MGGGGGAPRAPSNRGKSLESWCIANTVILRAWLSYKADKLLIAEEHATDELPPRPRIEKIYRRCLLKITRL